MAEVPILGVLNWVADMVSRQLPIRTIQARWRGIDDARQEAGLSRSRESPHGQRLAIALRRQVVINPPKHAGLTGEVFDIAILVPFLETIPEDGGWSTIQTARNRRTTLLLRMATGLRAKDVSKIFVSSISEISTLQGIKAVHFKYTPKQSGPETSLRFSMVEFLPDEHAAFCPARALVDYVAHRPECEDPYLFVTAKRPYRALSRQTISNYGKRLLQAAGKGDSFSSHSLRFLARNKWLACGVPAPEIRVRAGWAAPNREEQSYSSLTSSRNLALLSLLPLPEDDSGESAL